MILYFQQIEEPVLLIMAITYIHMFSHSTFTKLSIAGLISHTKHRLLDGYPSSAFNVSVSFYNGAP